MPPFLLDYSKRLHKKVLLSKEHLINDLKERIFDFEYQISNLKEKIDEQENSFIASEKEKRYHDSEIEKKDLEIKQIENKLNLEKKLSNSKINQLEAQLKTKDENISMLKRELEKFKYDFKRV
jgi:predicted RNase H-like nuclease (RuvC/YqgF family)